MSAILNQSAQRNLLPMLTQAMVLAVVCLLAACSTTPQRYPAQDAITSQSVAEESTAQSTESDQQPAQGSSEPVDESFNLGDEVALRAIAQVGKPYRYGGADLKGFDCSGLVYFVHHDIGISVPRTASQQYAASTPVNAQKLMPGDLLFFHTSRRKRISHVGIYAGDGRFVHAPQTGGRIEVRELSDDYYSKRFIGAGRLHGSNQ
jgi:murein DD-endopeptidase